MRAFGRPARRAAFSTPELPAACVNGDHAGLRVEGRIEVVVVVVARDLTDPPAGVVAHDEHDELSRVTGRVGEDAQPRSGVAADATAQVRVHPRPAATHGRRDGVAVAHERDPRVRRDAHGRAGRDLCRVDEQRHAAALAGVQAHERLFEAQRRDGRHGLRRDRGGAVHVDGPPPDAASPVIAGARSAACAPAWNAALPGVSKAVLSASLSARSPTWSRARSAFVGRIERALWRRSSSATIGARTRSIAAYSARTTGWVSLSPLRSTFTTTCGRRAPSAARCSSSSASQRTSP